MSERRFQFWRKWLTWANVMTLVVGLSVAFAGNSWIFELHNAGTKEVFLGGENFSPEVLSLKNWLFGIIGGTIVGFHSLMVFLSEIPFRRKEPWSYWAMIVGMGSWFVIDTSISWYYDAFHNIVLINLVALALIGIPLVATFRVFQR